MRRRALALVLAAAAAAGGLAVLLRPRAPSPPGFDPAVARSVVESYSRLMHALYSDAVVQAESLRGAVAEFIDRPTPEGIQACRDAWLAARPVYLQTEVARFYEGPIDGGADAPEKLLNAWPLDEAYIDYVRGDPGAGIINDPARYPRIDRATLRGANEQGGEANIATGWHAVEFLLWGQDLELGPGGGKRPHLDYVPGGGAGARRAAYLRTCADMIVEDLVLLREQWAPGKPDNYRSWLAGLEPRNALGKIMTGVATLAFGELRGERLITPYTTKDREDEHSCFSDSTHLDHLNDMIGIRNVWTGRHRDLAGPGLRDLAPDPRLAARVDASLEDCLEALRDPRMAPFETAIQGLDSDPGRRAVHAAIQRLLEFNEAFFELSTRMGVPINTQLQKGP